MLLQFQSMVVFFYSYLFVAWTENPLLVGRSVAWMAVDIFVKGDLHKCIQIADKFNIKSRQQANNKKKNKYKYM